MSTLDVWQSSEYLSDMFSMHPFSTPWKHKKTLRFSDVLGGGEGVNWKRMG